VLALSALTMGVDKRRVDEMLELVGLSPKESRRRVRNYSLGMRQRLGIANALLGDPQMLILDEPVNGLDPAGIRWMRSLLRGFAGDGGTVLLSSHLLFEMDAVADDLIVIGHGKIVAQGAKEELLAVAGSVVSSVDDATLAAALQRAGFEAEVRPGGGLSTPASTEEVGRVALAAGVALTGLGAAENNGLEELFFDLTSEHGREEVGAA
jgi:ABC-2 type transport system ATP-binding protein